MTTAFEQLQRASFAGIEFPVKTLRVRGGLRDHVHEYPHTPGGAPEKLGRKLYEFEVEPLFDARAPASYPNLWPGKLAQLVRLFEGETTDTLVVPIIGSVQAYCTNWDQAMVRGKLSGPDVTWHFREDQSSAFLVDQLVSVGAQRITTLTDALVAASLGDGFKPGFFAAIKALGDQVLALVDQVEAADDALASKVDGLTALCEAADADLELLQPKNFRTMSALHDLWAANLNLHKDLLKKAREIITFSVPRPMTVGDVSIALYGDASHAGDIMRLNPLPNPLRIESGMSVRAYAP